jgi:hypothetical protein
MYAAIAAAASRPTALTPRALEALLAYIRDGAYDWVAAEAAGIGRRPFHRWMRRGERGEQSYAELYRRVWHARGLARAEAEAWVRRRHPLAWLKLRPGRERPSQPGWTNAAPAGLDELPAEANEPEALHGLAQALREVRFDPDYDPRDYDDPEDAAPAQAAEADTPPAAAPATSPSPSPEPPTGFTPWSPPTDEEATEPVVPTGGHATPRISAPDPPRPLPRLNVPAAPTDNTTHAGRRAPGPSAQPPAP